LVGWEGARCAVFGSGRVSEKTEKKRWKKKRTNRKPRLAQRSKSKDYMVKKDDSKLITLYEHKGHGRQKNLISRIEERGWDKIPAP